MKPACGDRVEALADMNVYRTIPAGTKGVVVRPTRKHLKVMAMVGDDAVPVKFEGFQTVVCLESEIRAVGKP